MNDQYDRALHDLGHHDEHPYMNGTMPESMMEVRSYNSLRVDPASPMPTPMHNDSDYYGESGHHMMKPHDPMLSSAHGHDEDHYTGFNSVEMARAVPLPAQPLNYFNNGTGPLPGGAVRAIPVSSPPVSPAHRNGAPLMATATVIPAHAVAAAVPAVAVARPFPASSPTSSNGGSFKAKQTTPRSPHFSAGGNPNGATPAFAKPGQDLWDTVPSSELSGLNLSVSTLVQAVQELGGLHYVRNHKKWQNVLEKAGVPVDKASMSKVKRFYAKNHAQLETIAGAMGVLAGGSNDHKASVRKAKLDAKKFKSKATIGAAVPAGAQPALAGNGPHMAMAAVVPNRFGGPSSTGRSDGSGVQAMSAAPSLLARGVSTGANPAVAFANGGGNNNGDLNGNGLALARSVSAPVAARVLPPDMFAHALPALPVHRVPGMEAVPVPPPFQQHNPMHRNSALMMAATDVGAAASAFSVGMMSHDDSDPIDADALVREERATHGSYRQASPLSDDDQDWEDEDDNEVEPPSYNESSTNDVYNSRGGDDSDTKSTGSDDRADDIKSPKNKRKSAIMAPAKKQRNGSIFKRLKVPPSLAHRLYLVERDEREMTLERQFAVMDAMGDVFRVSIGYRHHCSCDQQSHLPFSSNMPGAVQSPTHANSPAFNFPSAAGTQSQSPSHAFSSSITSPLSSPAHPSEPSSRAASALSLTGSGNSPVRRENESTATNMQGQSGFNNAQTSSLIQPLCRHIVFVLTRVLKVSRESRYMVQRELQASDLMDIYARAPPNPWNSVSSVMNTIIEEVTKRAAQEHSLMSSANRASASRRELKRSSSQSSLQNKEKEQPKRKEASGPEMVWGLTSAPEDMDAWSDADSEISGCADMTSGPNGDLMDLMDIFGGHAGGGKHASPTTLSECNICFEPFGSERLTYCMAKCGNNFHQTCFSLWASRFPSHNAVTCPLCRSPWRDSEFISPESVGMSGPGHVPHSGYRERFFSDSDIGSQLTLNVNRLAGSVSGLMFSPLPQQPHHMQPFAANSVPDLATYAHGSSSSGPGMGVSLAPFSYNGNMPNNGGGSAMLSGHPLAHGGAFPQHHQQQQHPGHSLAQNGHQQQHHAANPFAGRRNSFGGSASLLDDFFAASGAAPGELTKSMTHTD